MQVQGKLWSTANSVFVPCGSKIGDALSSKMCYVTSHKAWNYKSTSSKEMARCREFPKAKQWRFTKHEASVNLRKLWDNFINIWSSGTSHCQFWSSETHTTRSQKSWHSFAGHSLVLSDIVSCIALSLLWLAFIAVCDVIRMKPIQLLFQAPLAPP